MRPVEVRGGRRRRGIRRRRCANSSREELEQPREPGQPGRLPDPIARMINDRGDVWITKHAWEHDHCMYSMEGFR